MNSTCEMVSDCHLVLPVRFSLVLVHVDQCNAAAAAARQDELAVAGRRHVANELLRRRNTWIRSMPFLRLHGKPKAFAPI